ncbi:MAG: diaminopimelate decarboxylase [Bacteroidaceae bacterium]|nr:diaminopimelate decarboxylase [Bacteroidaceae bacterium]
MTTPYYQYDLHLLQRTLDELLDCISAHPGWHVHYAIKANANPLILEPVRKSGLGIDCVSGFEIEAALKAGFNPSGIVFAGVGKADWEIDMALRNDIFCFNVESEAELEVIQERALIQGKTARIAFRVNPDVDAHTHSNITTGLAGNKFGINLDLLEDIVARSMEMKGISPEGLHFHIGSQILDMNPFAELCSRINGIQQKLKNTGFTARHINVGGGLGVDYGNPEDNPIPDFRSYFDTFSRHLALQPGQELHFELGRSIVAQCGQLITRVLYVKKNPGRQFAITDAGMTDLIRPALYGAYHRIVNRDSSGQPQKYDVVGPVCESSDIFGKDRMLNEVRRGDTLAIMSAGAYGETMASRYNLRRLPGSTSLEAD